jgi:hypothetical protein
MFFFSFQICNSFFLIVCFHVFIEQLLYMGDRKFRPIIYKDRNCSDRPSALDDAKLKQMVEAITRLNTKRCTERLGVSSPQSSLF